MALFKKIKNIFKKENKKLKPDSPDVDPMDAFMEEWINETNLKKKDLITKFETGDKKKLIEIKKKLKIDKFNKALNSNKNRTIFNIIEDVTKIEFSMFDEFTIKMSLAKFFNKMSNQLIYEPIINFKYDSYDYSENSEYGLLKCILNKKGAFQNYLIFYSAWGGDHMNLGTPDGTMSPVFTFNLNEKIDNKKLFNSLDNHLKKSKNKFTANKVYLFKKLNWSKEKLKKYINKKDFLVFMDKY